MKEKFKEFFKKYFKNKNLKAKTIVGLVIATFILTMTGVIMRKSILINVDGQIKEIVTYSSTVKGALKVAGIEVMSKDKVIPNVDSKIKDNDEIEVTKAVKVNVVIAGQEHEVLTAENTVEDMLVAEKELLDSSGVDFDDDDEVVPSRQSIISKDMEIKLTQVEIRDLVESESIDYQVVKKVDYDKDINSAEDIVQPGKSGTKSVSYKVYEYEDGSVNKVKQSEIIVNVPQDKIVVQGGSNFMASRSGDAIKIKEKTIIVDATSYYCGDNAITATGRRAIRNPNGISTIAVDPRVIPLGTLVYIQGYGKAVAADVGTAVKGNMIDVYLSSMAECRAWGRKVGIKVGIIAYPGQW